VLRRMERLGESLVECEPDGLLGGFEPLFGCLCPPRPLPFFRLLGLGFDGDVDEEDWVVGRARTAPQLSNGARVLV
jgi:hypothetical protein